MNFSAVKPRGRSEAKVRWIPDSESLNYTCVICDLKLQGRGKKEKSPGALCPSGKAKELMKYLENKGTLD